MNLQKSIEECYSQVYFLIREGLYSRLQDFCEECYKQFSDPFFIFWKSFGIMKEKRIPEAINELNQIMNKREIQYSVLSLLIQLHENSQLIDDEQLDSLKFQFQNSESGSSDKTLMLTARQLMYSDQLEEAERVLSNIKQPGKECQVTQGWINYHKGDQDSLRSSLEIFNNVLSQQKNNLEALLGSAKSAQNLKKYTESLDFINELVVYYEDNLTVMLEKAQMLMIINDWDQCLEIVNKIQMKDKSNLILYKIMLFHKLAVEGEIENFIMMFKQFISLMKIQEGRNSQFMYEVSRLFSRMCGRNNVILSMSIKLLEECRKLEPINSDYVIELGYQSLMTQQYSQAYTYYQEAAALDETRLESLTGMIQCRICQNEVEDAQNQLEFVNEIQIEGKSSQVAFLEALIHNKKNDQAAAIKSIDEALKLHIQMTKSLMPGFNFFTQLDPDYLIQLAQQYHYQISLMGLLEQQKYNQNYIVKGIKLLETVVKQIPSHLNAHLLLARGKLAIGDHSKSGESLSKVQAIQPNNIDMFILNALIMILQGNQTTALSNLQQSIANNFLIRENVLFLLIKGNLELQLKDYQSAINTLEEGVNMTAKTNNSNNKQQDLFRFGEMERCLIYTNLAKAYALNKQLDKAKEIINKSIGEFAGTDQEMNVLLANSEIAIESNDIKKALSILRAVNVESHYYSQSRKLMAEVYLTHLKDRRNYTKCYTDLVESNPTFENYKLLGKAMLQIQEPEEALAAFQKAQQITPNDQQVILLIGQSLTLGHYYQRAIQYYQQILQTQKKLEYFLEIGQLLIKTKRYTEAEQYLKVENFVDEFNTYPYQDMKLMVQGLQSIYYLHTKKQGLENYKTLPQAQTVLEKAIQFQSDLIEKGKDSGINTYPDRDHLALLYYKLANHMYFYEKQSAKALACLDRAMKIIIDDIQCIELIIRIYFENQEKQLCEKWCLHLLKLQPNTDYGTFIYSELLIQKEQEQQAIDYFRQMFLNNTQNYTILQRLIDLECRYGNQENVKSYIEMAEKNSNNILEQGLCFCRGLFYKYQLENDKALMEFNKSKRASQFREKSVYHMILIYLNPQSELWINQSSKVSLQINKDVIDCSLTLLKELYESSINQQLLQAVITIMENNISNASQLERSIQVLSDICRDNSEFVPGQLFLSIGKYLTGKQTECKNHLKLLSKKNYSSVFHNELEMSWLLYADSFIAISKFDNAEEILKKCLKYNRCCAKAEEFMGLIKEKESMYIDAAQHYEKAFSITNSKNISIGYRLAFNYFKAKRYIECLDICNKILNLQPEFTLAKELIVKTRQLIRI